MKNSKKNWGGGGGEGVGLGGQDGCEIQKKIIFFLGGGGGVRVDVNEKLKFL